MLQKTALTGFFLFAILVPLPNYTSVRSPGDFDWSVSILEDRMFFDPVTAGEEASLSVSVKSNADEPYNGTISVVARNLSTSDIVYEIQSEFHMVPGKEDGFRFKTEPLIPGQYVVEASVQIQAVYYNEDGNLTYEGFATLPVSMTFQALSDQDFNNRIIAYSTIVVAVTSSIIALLGLRSQRKHAAQTLAEMQTQREATLSAMGQDRKISEATLDISKETMRQQLRPWIGRVDIVLDGAHIEDGTYVTVTQVPNLLQSGRPIKSLVFKFWLQNYGKLPAQNFSSGYGIMTSDDPKMEPRKEWLDNVTFSQNISVMPGEKIPVNIEVSAEKLNHFFVVGRVKYRYSGGTGFYDYIMEFANNNFTPKYNEAG